MARASVLFVAHWDWVLANFRLPIARALRDDGWDVRMVCPRGEHTPQIAREFQVLPWTCVDRRSMNPVREVPAVRELVGIYRRVRPDVVQHFTVKPNLYGSVAARLADVPVTVNMFSGLGYLFGDEARARAVRKLATPVMRRLFTAPDTWMLALNDEDLARLETLGLTPPGRTRRMPEGIDTARFHPASGRELDGPPVAVTAARLLRTKGVQELVEAARRLNQGEVAVRVQIAGETDPGNPASLTDDEVRELATVPGVEFLGHRSDMDEVLRDADIGVLATRYNEGMPCFLQEAMATALPVISTDVQGCRDLVDDGVTGYLVPPGDVRSLAQRLRDLTDPDRRSVMGAAGRAHVAQHHSEEVVQRAWLGLYRDLRPDSVRGGEG